MGISVRFEERSSQPGGIWASKSTKEKIQNVRTYFEVNFYDSEHSLKKGGSREPRGQPWKGAGEARDRSPHSPTKSPCF
jgi:hypothetical protein